MKNNSKKTLLANVFGTFGYLFCLFLWGWIGLLYLPMLLENENIAQLLLPTPSEEVPAYTPSVEMSPFMVFVALAITAVVIVATILVFLRAPLTVARTGKAVTTKAADSALPVITRHHKLAPSRKKLLTVRLIKLAKLLLTLIPVIIGFALGGFVAPPLPFDVTAFVTSILALCALQAFSAQYIFARLLKVDPKQLV